MKFVLVAGNTATAEIDGISAAGSDPAATAHTPAADLEVVTYGRPVTAPSVPVSPAGCPSPAVVTRAARELLGFETIPVDAGLAASTGAPTVDFGAEPGNDVRDRLAVPDARATLDTARRFGRALPDDELAIGETVPGGTTTAMAVLAALGERATVSSSLPENPLSLKRAVVRDALAASELERGATAGEPVETLRRVGDPVLAAATGLALGATEAGTAVTLAGGTQMAAVAALVRHAGVEAPLALETTSFVAADETASLEEVAADLAVETTVTDPGFDRRDHPATNAYVAGHAKEGVGMGAALGLVERSGISMGTLRDRLCDLTDELLGDDSTDERRADDRTNDR